MITRVLTEDLIDDLIEFELEARRTEDIFIQAFNVESYKKKMLEYLPIRNENAVLLAYENDQVIGRIDCMINISFMDFYKNGYIDWIYVLKAYRKKGIGKCLIQEAEKYFKSKDVSDYYLFTAANEEAQAFYYHQAFKIEKKEVASKEL